METWHKPAKVPPIQCCRRCCSGGGAGGVGEMPQLNNYWIIDGEVQGDIAVNAKKLEATFPFSPLKSGANILIFPDLESSNIACKLLASVGGAEAVGPILMGMARPVHLLSLGAEVEEVVDMATLRLWMLRT